MNQKIWFLGTLLMMSVFGLSARYHSVQTQREFESFLNQYEYAVVCFAPSKVMEGAVADRDEKDDVRHEFKALQSKLKSASDREKYRQYLKKDVGFLLVNVATTQADEIAKDFALKEFPTCLLFESGEVSDQQPLLHPKSASDIIKFLEHGYGDQIQDLLEDRKDDARLLRQERIASYYSYPTYWRNAYWDWPYGQVRGYPYYATLNFGYGF